MKNDFRKMEDEMDNLATNMSSITEFSANISGTLQDRRQQITKLSGVHSLLKRVINLLQICFVNYLLSLSIGESVILEISKNAFTTYQIVLILKNTNLNITKFSSYR